MSAANPRLRLSLYTNSNLGHDVSAALKASQPQSNRSAAIEETPAPPPSPVDFGFPTPSIDDDISTEWSIRTTTSKPGLVGA